MRTDDDGAPLCEHIDPVKGLCFRRDGHSGDHEFEAHPDHPRDGITTSLMVLQVVLDTLKRRKDVNHETRITLVQRMLDNTERELTESREWAKTSKFSDVSIGSRVNWSTVVDPSKVEGE